MYISPVIFFHTINQWKREDGEPFTLDIVNAYIDKDDMLDRYDLGIILFGFGVSLKVNTFDKGVKIELSSEKKDEMWQNIKREIDKGPR